METTTHTNHYSPINVLAQTPLIICNSISLKSTNFLIINTHTQQEGNNNYVSTKAAKHMWIRALRYRNRQHNPYSSPPTAHAWWQQPDQANPETNYWAHMQSWADLIWSIKPMNQTKPAWQNLTTVPGLNGPGNRKRRAHTALKPVWPI